MSEQSPTPPHVIASLRAAGCVYAEEEARILVDATRSDDGLAALVERRAAGEPLEYIVGWASLCGLRVSVVPGVFVPRRRSEFLVDCAVDAVNAARLRVAARLERVRVVDMCCGSGAIGLAVATRAGEVELFAADDSPRAVACARENLAQVRGRVFLGDLFEALPPSELAAVDVVVANAPYVPTDEIARLPAEARVHEPAAALDGGHDGTDVQCRILNSAAAWLRPSGRVLIETSLDMADHTAEIAAGAGFSVEVRESRDFGVAVVVATRGR